MLRDFLHRLHHQKIALVLLLALCLSVVLFQNCIGPSDSRVADSRMNGNNTGYDGKIFEVRLADGQACPDGDRISARVIVLDRRVILMRENCLDILGGRIISASLPTEFADYFNYNDQRYEWNPNSNATVLGTDAVAVLDDGSAWIYYVDRRSIARMSYNGQNRAWAKKFPETVTITSAKLLQNGNIAIAGSLENRAMLSIMNINGQLVEAREYKTISTMADLFESITTDSSGNLFIAARSVVNAASKPLPSILKLDSSGNPLWQLRFPGFRNSDRIANRVATAPGGDVFVLAGAVFRRISGDGKVVWTRIFESDNNENSTHWHEIHDLRSTSEGGFLVAGKVRATLVSTDSAGLTTTYIFPNGYIGEFDGEGSLINARSIPIWTHDDTGFYSALKRTDGSYLAISYRIPVRTNPFSHGYTSFDKNFNFEWGFSYVSPWGKRVVLETGANGNFWIGDEGALGHLTERRPDKCVMPVGSPRDGGDYPFDDPDRIVAIDEVGIPANGVFTRISSENFVLYDVANGLRVYPYDL